MRTMLSDAPLPIAAPDTFAADIERDLPSLLAKRLGRPGTADELQAYRQLLWAVAIALGALDRSAPTPPSTPSCPVPLSTRGSPPSPTTGRR
jgi:hypothetical protein